MGLDIRSKMRQRKLKSSRIQRTSVARALLMLSPKRKRKPSPRSRAVLVRSLPTPTPKRTRKPTPKPLVKSVTKRKRSPRPILRAFAPGDVTHILLTRYNLGIYDGGMTVTQRNYDPAAWMQTRRELFRTYCAPSVMGQVCDDFKWLVFFDSETPVAEITAVVEGLDCVVLRSKKRELKNTTRAWVRRNVKTSWVVTTRLDSDDAIHLFYMRDLSRMAQPKTEVMCFSLGWNLIVRGRRRATTTLPWHGSGFMSLTEPTETAVTAFSQGHCGLYKDYPYRALQGRRWLRVLHWMNNSNLNAGVRCRQDYRIAKHISLAQLHGGFPFLAKDK